MEMEAGSCAAGGGSVEWVEMTGGEPLEKNPLVPDSGRYWCYRIYWYYWVNWYHWNYGYYWKNWCYWFNWNNRNYWK